MINTKRNKIVTAGDGIEVFLAKWTQNVSQVLLLVGQTLAVGCQLGKIIPLASEKVRNDFEQKHAPVPNEFG